MTIEMYDLAGADANIRFSPFCWRTRMALAHKALDVKTVPIRFMDKPKLAFSNQTLVPVIRDGQKVVSDSWTIAEYLDEAYPERARLMDGAQGKALANFARHYAQNVISAAVLKGVLLDIYNVIDAGDKPYFRETREKRFGMTLEAFTATPEAALAGMKSSTAPLRALLQSQSFINGDKPAFADYCVFGPFMWARNVSKVKLLEEDDAVYAWRERMLDLFDGLARKSPGVGA